MSTFPGKSGGRIIIIVAAKAAVGGLCILLLLFFFYYSSGTSHKIFEWTCTGDSINISLIYSTTIFNSYNLMNYEVFFSTYNLEAQAGLEASVSFTYDDLITAARNIK